LFKVTNNQKEISMSVELKIKSKHLSLEAKVIRFEENKIKKQIKWLYKNEPTGVYYKQLVLGSLYNHRKDVVGTENRATFLARAYLAGKTYTSTERSRVPEKEEFFQRAILPRVYEMVKKYGSFDVRRSITVDILKEWSKIE
jgi:hypothetical protein